ncbi:RNA polymerase sigma factor [Arundinibacter roseus]|uniref:RNA polymerase sigma factor n=1 Tax=Arundinibacter roseus TaxID=2070510 RepID=A0A4R4KBT3_9BACT|nr:RNA polymerase sigma factor [Arundinibacter roseus]TDB63659.1 RNA polymerase sigma factor [Arundinibacter roseus]
MVKIIPLFNQEAQLIKGLREANAKAQRKVYEKYAPKMLGVCLRYVHDEMGAEDVLIEGFMKVFDKIDQFKGEGSFEGWIRRIMVNEALGYLRQQKRIQEDTNLEVAQVVADENRADQNLEAEEMIQMIHKLPTGYRTVFNLYAIEGYSHAEIAEMLGISESTSKSQLHRARALLQQVVIDWENEIKKKVNYEKASGR